MSHHHVLSLNENLQIEDDHRFYPTVFPYHLIHLHQTFFHLIVQNVFIPVFYSFHRLAPSFAGIFQDCKILAKCLPQQVPGAILVPFSLILKLDSLNASLPCLYCFSKLLQYALLKSCQEAWAKIDSDHHKNKESLQSKFRMPPQLILRASNNLPAGRQILLSVFAGTS